MRCGTARQAKSVTCISQQTLAAGPRFAGISILDMHCPANPSPGTRFVGFPRLGALGTGTT
jgi:hypothetical protein